MTTDREEQAERIATMRQDANLRQQQQTSTLHQHAQAQADELSQGRFRATGTPSVTGTTPIPSYPVGNQWAAADQNNLEPPFPVDINALEPCGEPHEIEASIAELKVSPLEPFSAQGNSPSPASEAVAPPDPLGVEQRDAGLGPLPSPSHQDED